MITLYLALNGKWLSMYVILRPRVHQSVFFSWGWRIFSIVLNGSTAFFKTPGACRALSVFFALTLSVRAFFSRRREKNVQLWIKRCAHQCHFLVKPTNQSGGGAGLQVFIFFTRLNCRTTIILLWKIMLWETFHLRRVCIATTACQRKKK